MYTAKNDYRAFCEMVANADSLEHHGIKGQRWGVRRFQYENGKLTREGMARYNVAVKNKNKAKEVYKATKNNTIGVSDAEHRKKTEKAKMLYKQSKKAEKEAYEQLKKNNAADREKESTSRKSIKRVTNMRELNQKNQANIKNYMKSVKYGVAAAGLGGAAIYLLKHPENAYASKAKYAAVAGAGASVLSTLWFEKGAIASNRIERQKKKIESAKKSL